jgi:hypothetical protein
MKVFVCFILLVIILFACTKEKGKGNSTPGEEIAVMVYATHANDTTKIVTTDSLHVTLR